MSERDSIIHLVAGGVAGTAGAVVTCPLEVVKTRLQSSNAFLPISRSAPRISELTGFQNSATSDALRRPEQRRKFSSTILRRIRPQKSPIKTLRKNFIDKIRLKVNVYAISHCGISSAPKSMSILQCLRHIVQTEGSRALFKGLGPNIVGVAPSRAIYFCTYSQTKEALSNFGLLPTDSPFSHILSASCAGFVSSTVTNPIWFIKTRLQLDHNSQYKMTVRECIKQIYQTSGFRGFYKGITASYFGISETVVHFVIYETLKRKLMEMRQKRPEEGKSTRDFVEFMIAGATSKTIASCIAYPHEVARTRLREEGNKYNKFWQTLYLVWREEGKAGLYRGLATQLVRQIPNTAIMMATYEAVVYILSMKFNATFYLEGHRNGNSNGKSH